MKSFPHIVLVAGDNLVADLLLQNLIPGIMAAGFMPKLFITPGSPKVEAVPSLRHYSFYEGALLQDTIYPFLEQQPFARMPYRAPKTFLRQMSCAPVRIQTLSDPAFLAALDSPDLAGVLSLRNYAIFPQALIDRIKRKGFLWNLHTGSLPDYRGVFIPFWSMSYGEERYGWTLHDIDAGIDTGGVIDSVTQKLNRTSVLHAYMDLVEDAADMILLSLHRHLANQLTIKEQSLPAAYYSFPNEDRIAEARAQGVKLWGSPAEMLRLYQRLYGEDERLAELLMNAIAAHESGRSLDSTEAVAQVA